MKMRGKYMDPNVGGNIEFWKREWRSRDENEINGPWSLMVFLFQ